MGRRSRSGDRDQPESDADRRRDVAALLTLANEVVVPQSRSAERAAFLQKLGFEPFDALHLACAEEGRADVFLTTDDDLVRRAGRRINEIRTRVMNPVSWYQHYDPSREYER
jgi:predicted nucleic acid-binding protein